MRNTPSMIERLRFSRFGSLVTRVLGIRMPDQKRTMLEGRLQKRLRALNLKSFEEYESYLFDSPNAEEELVHFLDSVTTNKTDFFREPQQFKYLCQTALPELDAAHAFSATRPANIWCAGCSTGQEPYTLAMVLSEYGLLQRGFDFSILATDISTRVLGEAKTAIYPEALVEPVAVELRKKYLLRSKDRDEGLVRIAPALRSKVRFGRLNFMDEDYGLREKFHVIFFRNVMIYFDKPTQEAVVRRMSRHLVPGGYLFIGLSESLAGSKIPFTPVHTSVYRHE
jgi:chemotaxis protein methyltransferase CheR